MEGEKKRKTDTLAPVDVWALVPEAPRKVTCLSTKIMSPLHSLIVRKRWREGRVEEWTLARP